MTATAQSYGDYADPSYGSGASYGYTPQGYDFSQQGYAATNYAPTLNDAISQFYQANPTAPGNPNPPAGANSNLASLFQPQYLGTPATYSASTVTSPTAQGTNANAAQFDLAGLYGNWGAPTAVSSVAPSQGTTASAANYDLGSLYGNWGGASQLSPGLTSSLGAGSTIDELLQGFAPQAQSAQNNLTQMLANFGVGGGQAVGATTQLQAQLAASLAPSIASAIQNSQANQLNAGEFDTSAQNTNTSALNSALASALGQNTSNQQATNTLNATQGQQNNQFNTSNALTAALQNAAAGNTNTNALNSQLATALGQNAANVQATNQFNASQGQQNNQFNASDALSAALANAQAANTASQYGATAANSTNAANVAEFNDTQQQDINNLLNQYYAQLGAFSNINNSGQSAANQNAVNYGQDITVQQDPFTQIFGALAGAGAQLGSAAIASGA